MNMNQQTEFENVTPTILAPVSETLAQGKKFFKLKNFDVP